MPTDAYNRESWSKWGSQPLSREKPLPSRWLHLLMLTPSCYWFSCTQFIVWHISLSFSCTHTLTLILWIYWHSGQINHEFKQITKTNRQQKFACVERRYKSLGTKNRRRSTRCRRNLRSSSNSQSQRWYDPIYTQFSHDESCFLVLLYWCVIFQTISLLNLFLVKWCSPLPTSLRFVCFH